MQDARVVVRIKSCSDCGWFGWKLSPVQCKLEKLAEEKQTRRFSEHVEWNATTNNSHSQISEDEIVQTKSKMMLSYIKTIVLVIVAQSNAFYLPNAISHPTTAIHQSLLAVNDASLEVTDYDLDKHANVEREDVPVILRSVVSIDNVDTSTTTVVNEENIYEIYKSTHPTTNEKIGNQFEKWILKLFNDSDNTRIRVCHCLIQHVGLSEEESYMKMMREAIIGEYCREHAEYYKEALVGSGIVCDIFPVEEWE